MLRDYCPNLPTFYKQIILNWRKVNNTITIDNKEKIKNEGIWLNNRITTKNTPLYCGPSMRKGIKYISDLLSPEGNFLDHIQLNRKFNATWTFLDILKVRLTIPSEWKNILLSVQEENLEKDVIYNKLNNLKLLKTKDIYILLLEAEHDLSSISASQIYWQTKYKIDEDTMKLVYTLIKQADNITVITIQDPD
jgi:hypothetical protein